MPLSREIAGQTLQPVNTEMETDAPRSAAGDRAHYPGRAGAAQLLGHPDARLHQFAEIDPGLNAQAVQLPDQVLGGQVPGGALGVGQPPSPPADASTVVTPRLSAASVLASAWP